MCPTIGVPQATDRTCATPKRRPFPARNSANTRKNGNLPRFIVMSLGEDHTTGTTPGTFTPQACVASNDLALGAACGGGQPSKYWPQMAIFVIEDDAQNGPDHVDAHRTAGLVISPYVRRKISTARNTAR